MAGTVITIGTFDGVHLGHQAVLRQTTELSIEQNLASIAYTFPFPQKQIKPCLLLPQSIKVKLLNEYVDQVITTEFPTIQDLSPKQFFDEIIIKQLSCRAIVVGESFRFGHDRTGDLSLLKNLGKEQGLLIVGVPPIKLAGSPVSSTQIRSLVRAGDILTARSLMERFPLLFGEVAPGDRLGRQLGYPTANLKIPQCLLVPATGVYLVYAFWERSEGTGLLYIGTRPTLDRSEMRFELHLSHPPKDDLYGTDMELHLLRRIREEKVFSTLAGLRHQIGLDLASAHSLFRAIDPPTSVLA